MHGNRRATCHIDNRRSFCIREGKGCRGVAHVGHAISAAGHCLLFVAHVQLERNSRECPRNESYFLACVYRTRADDAEAGVWSAHAHACHACEYTPSVQHCIDNRIYRAVDHEPSSHIHISLVIPLLEDINFYNPTCEIAPRKEKR